MGRTHEGWDEARALLETRELAPLFGERDGAAALVSGAPRSGKTTLALAATARAMDVFGEARTSLAVSDRQLADRYAPLLIRHAGVTTQARPATTLNALAFRLVTALRAREGRPLPKLLNGAEQDALLRRVLDVHLEHVRAGDMCATCRMLRDYFADEHWERYVTDPASRTDPGTTSSQALFEGGVNATFTAQLRDMLARMDEAGATNACEHAVLAAIDDGGLTSGRLAIQWRLAFALRAEYVEMIARAHPGEYRLDSSYLQVAATDAARRARSEDLPAMLVVDDFQDVTLAGFAFLQALHERGVRLLLVGNPDEAVQTFRGSHPEYLFAQAVRRLRPARLALAWPCEGRAADYLDTVAARVSLSIASEDEQDMPLAKRPGKMPDLNGAQALRPMDVPESDTSVRAARYRSALEELDDVVWGVKTAHLEEAVAWNDMALIAHDNDTVRAFGERLRRDGVPVRFSSVTRPLADEPFVQALFAVIELARLRNEGLQHRSMTLMQAAAFVRSRVRMIERSPLLDAPSGDRRGGPRPVDMTPVDAALRSLQALADVVRDGARETGETDGCDARNAEASRSDGVASSALAALAARWDELRARIDEAREDAADAQVRVDESIVDPQACRTPGFGVDAMYLLLAQDGAPDVLDAVARICGTLGDEDAPRRAHAGPNAPARRFERLWTLVDEVAGRLRDLESADPQFALEAAWQACGVDRAWQREALFNTPEGRAANDRLDAAMRLFEYARAEGVAPSIEGFIDQVRQLRIEADSLAAQAPLDDAVTVTTPAGAAGRSWRRVWLPAVQQGVWPNLAARNTMFGGEDLVDILLYGVLDEQREIAAGRGDITLREVLATEQKSFLVALTRADERVHVSAVLDDDLVPSDFLYAYLPERFDRAWTPTGDGDGAHGYTRVGAGRGDTLDVDARGLIALARIALAGEATNETAVEDALGALETLADGGVEAADPGCWPFLDAWNDPDARARGTRAASAEDSPAPSRGHAGRAVGDADRATAEPAFASPWESARVGAARSGQAPVVVLSPSKVDRLWECPVCARMEQQFFGPQPSGVSADFGSLIHDVARQAADNGWDGADHLASLPRDERVEALTEQMVGLYERMRDDPMDIEDARERYRALLKDDAARDTLAHIAAYFVDSNRPDYDTGGKTPRDIGTLVESRTECPFTARFSIADVVDAYNAIEDVDPIDADTMAAIMGSLVGGWPESMRADLVVRLTGRFDRYETRRLRDGALRGRIIDYKTGRAHGPAANFNDLQLVCYQLALAFPEDAGRSGAEAVRAMPDLAQCALFDVQEADYPANSGSTAEAYFQDALFRDGALNAHAFVPRYRVTGLGKLFSIELDEEPPAGVDAHAWGQFRALRGTMAVWAVTMIARVFYAAAVTLADLIEAHPQPEHAAACGHKRICPACDGRIATVFETREG